jgi:hypothetical protein
VGQVPPNPTNPGPSAKSNVIASYELLIRVMNRLYKHGTTCPPFTILGAQLRSESSVPYPGKLKAYLETAERAGIVKILGTGETALVRLAPQHIQSEDLDSPPADDSDSDSDSSSDSVPPIFLALLSVIKQLEERPRAYVTTSAVSLELSKRHDGKFRAAGYKKIKLLVEAAETYDLVKAIFAHGLGGIDMVRSNI